MSGKEIDFLLTFEWNGENEMLEIHGNQAGLEKLRDAINSLLSKKSSDHVHLMTKDWGGDELSCEKQCEENQTINHVKIFQWSEMNDLDSLQRY